MDIPEMEELVKNIENTIKSFARIEKNLKEVEDNEQ